MREMEDNRFTRGNITRAKCTVTVNHVPVAKEAGRCSISKGHNSSISVLGGVNYHAWLVAHTFFTQRACNEGTVAKGAT